ncbi:type II toxin-antitoxin system RelE/ParE family toxin [Capnocytophaga cynodegmi]|uniref:type II toxin-antitoxin system RelE/ParE family toxin n=1 Tax=Capnocytophaga cynodegmi TaxID=28189 RepID=UPI0038597B9B
MKVKWTERAVSKYFATLDYWDDRNKSNTYSLQIIDAVNKEVKSIQQNPYFLAMYNQKLDMYRRIFFKGKFSLFYRVDVENDTIWLMIFRSNKQKPID